MDPHSIKPHVCVSLSVRGVSTGFCVKMSRGGFSTVCCIFLILALWVVEQTGATPIRDGLLPNGDFEYAPKPSSMNGTVVIGKNSIPFWQIGGFVEYISSGQKQGDMLLIVPNGVHAAWLGNGARLTQRIEVKKGSYYSLTFSVARTCAQMETLNVSVPPDAGELPMQTIYSSTGWDSYSWAFRAPAKMADVIVHNPGMYDDPACGLLVDNIAIKELFPPPYVGGSLVMNGNFEEGPLIFPNSLSGVLLPPNTDDDTESPLPGWKLESLKAVKYIDAFHYSIPRGRRAVELLTGKESAIVQLVTTVVGQAYALSFLVGDGNNKCNGSMIVEAFGDRETVKVSYESHGSGGFKMGRLTFTATAARSRIAFSSTYYHMRSDDFSSLCGPVLDDIKLFRL